MYLAVAEVDTRVLVDVTLPRPQPGGVSPEIYIVENRDVGRGSVCPPATGRELLIAPGQVFVSTGLTDNTDSVLAVCIDSIVVALSYFAFETSDSISGGSSDPNAAVSIHYSW